MLEFTDAVVEKLIVHQVGNKGLEQDIILSNEDYIPEDEDTKDVLMRYFLSPFKGDVFFKFTHSSDLEMNEVYNFAGQIFDNPDDFHKMSKSIAQHLYDKSTHPMIKSGELYIAYFKECYVEDEVVDCVGIFKSENKDTFIRIEQEDGKLILNFTNGINVKKLDKGCLIFNTEKDTGFKTAIVDSGSKAGEEALFWKDQFLKLQQRKDDYYNTEAFIDICKGFTKEVISNKDNDLDKTDQVEFVKKTESYFKENEEFDTQDFVNKVIKEPEFKESFTEYVEEYQEEKNIQPKESFSISPEAVKKYNKNFKSVIKLDKNFHIYVHSSPDSMEKGYDESRGQNYYKLYFDKEK